MILLKKPRVVGFKGRWILPHQKVSHFLINPAVFPSPICSPPCRGWSHGGGPRSQSAVRWRGRSGSNTCGRNLWIWTHEHTTRDTHVHEYNKVNHTWLCVECSSLDMWGWCTCVCVCVCPDGVELTCQAYPGAPLLGSDSTGGCTPARPAARTSSAADSARTLLNKQTNHIQESHFRLIGGCYSR